MQKTDEIYLVSTEEQILKAATEVFLEKGFAASKTVEIARKAGVNHALLHYYFRTKENLFNKVFSEKMDFFISSFQTLFEQDLPFFELIESIIGTQYDFISENEKLPYFIINEILSSEQHRISFRDHLYSKLSNCFSRMEEMLDEEIEKGTIKKIRLLDLIVTIVSLNVFCFILKPATAIFSEQQEQVKDVMNERKKTHVNIVLSWIKV